MSAGKQIIAALQEACNAVPNMDEMHDKMAKVTIKLKAKSGYSCMMTAEISAFQWAAINAIIDGEA